MRIHWYYKFLIVSLVFFSMFFLFNKNISSFINNSSYKYYINSVFVPISSISNNSIFDCKRAKKENKELKREALESNNLKDINDSLTKEIESLKKLMKLKSTYTGYKTIYAKTISRNKMYWYSTITIDKGLDDGIKKNSAVVSTNGLIGIVKDTTKGTSTVKLITNSDTNSKISGIIKKGDKSVIGLIEGYEYPYIKVSLSSSEDNVKIGDEFYSYGLEGFPKNIYIGEVEKIDKDTYDLGNILYVKPKQDMNDINYLMVLSNK